MCARLSFPYPLKKEEIMVNTLQKIQSFEQLSVSDNCAVLPIIVDGTKAKKFFYEIIANSNNINKR